MTHPPTIHQSSPQDPPARLDVEALSPGDVLKLPVFTRQGLMLLASGTLVTETALAALQEIADTDLYLAEDDTPFRTPNAFTTPPPKTARNDWSIAVRVRNVMRLLVQEQGRKPEPKFEFGPLDLDDPMQTLRDRATLLKRADESVHRLERTWAHLPMRISPVVSRPAFTPSRGVHWPAPRHLDTLRANLIAGYRSNFARLAAGLGVSLDALLPLVDTLIDHYERYPDRFAQLLYAPGIDAADLPAHALLTSGASVAIALRLGWSRDDVRLAGIAGLVADAGMVMVPKEIRRSTDPLDALGTCRVDRHPTTTVALLRASDLPPLIALAAYQHHERLDGTGYPRRLSGTEICDLARVVGIADAYVASVSPRPYRTARRPYDAMEEIVLLAAKGVLDRKAVRALMEVTGLFPVGGYVRLSTGEAALVIGVDPERADRPVVRTVDTPEPREIALAGVRFEECFVVSPIDPPLSERRERAA